MSEVPDSIERTITIDRDAGTVYALIATPGWWINEGSITANQVTTVDGISMVTHDKYGTFRIRTIARRPPHYLAYRWQAGHTHTEENAENDGTLIEFFIEPVGSGVQLKVRESGFRAIPGSADFRRRNYNENAEGWHSELKAARRHLEGN